MNTSRKFYRFLGQIGLILTVLILVSACLGRDKSDTTQKQKNTIEVDYKIIGYVAGWVGLDFSTIQAEKLTHINYAFANCVDAEVIFGTDKDLIDDAQLNAKDLENLKKLKSINPNLKILISVGGWTWSKNFSDAALTNESREKFAQSAVEFLTRYNLDGVDLDWEYPGQIGDGNIFRPEDKGNFTLLLKRMRELLDAQSEIDGKTGSNKYLLTIATGANQAYIDNTDLREAQKYLDFINIMTYDFHSGLDTITGHHANLYLSDTPGTTNMSVVNSVKIHIEAGVPPEKLVLGVPFYGRKWSGVIPENNGLYQPAKTVGSTVSYRKIMTEYTEENGFQRYWDETAQSPILFNSNSQVFVSYEDTASLKLKLNWLKSNNLGGVMFWEYALDYNEELLHTINIGLNK